MSLPNESSGLVHWRGGDTATTPLQPELKTFFSSTWRVADGRRELLFIGGTGGSVSLRSLMDIGGMPDAKP